MSRTNTGLLIVVCCLVGVSVAEERRPAPAKRKAQKPLEFKTLKLRPEAARSNSLADKQLPGTSWVHYGGRNVRRVGTDRYLDFPKKFDGKWQVKLGSITYQGQPVRWSRRAVPAAISGSVLRIGRELHTFQLTPGREFAFSVVIPAGKNRWYYVGTETYSNQEVKLYEYLFEFQDDPTTKDRGRATVHRRMKGRHEDEVRKAPATFRVKVYGDGRRISFTCDSVNDSTPNVTDFTLYPKRGYGTVHGFIAARSTIYRAAKTAGNKQQRGVKPGPRKRN